MRRPEETPQLWAEDDEEKDAGGEQRARVFAERRETDGEGREIEEAPARHAGFVAGVDYTTASLLGFALGDRDVVSLDPAREQYDFWFDGKAHAGEDAILYADRWRPITRAVERRFASIEEIDSLVVRAQGRDIYRQRIYLAKGYKP